MNNEEAMGILSECMVRGGITREAENYAFWEVIRNALEKQIPKNPIMTGNKLFPYSCPTCGMYIDDVYYYNCITCGQKLLWSEE